MTTDRSLFDVSWKAITKVLLALALVWAWFQVWQFLMVIIVSIIIAVALDPAVQWLERHRLSRSTSAFGVVLLVTAVIIAMIAASWVTLRAQSRLIIQRLTESVDQLRASFPMIESLLPSGTQGGTDGMAQYAIGFARSTTTAVGMIVLALVLTVYLLIEWKRTLEWLTAFVPERHRTKTRRTLADAREIVCRYMVGTVI